MKDSSYKEMFVNMVAMQDFSKILTQIFAELASMHALPALAQLSKCALGVLMGIFLEAITMLLVSQDV